MTGSRRDGLLLLLVLVLGGALFATAAATRGFVGPDEPRYASIARELAASDDPVVLTLDGKLYREKPPLWYWAAAASGTLLGGFTDFTVRLPSVLAATLLLLVIARLGVRVLGDLRTGVVAAVIYALSVQGLNIGHRAYLDTLLTLLTTASALVFLGGLAVGRSGFRAHVLGWVFLGLAVLVKGPPALLPPLLAVGGWAIARRDPGAFRRIAPLGGLGVTFAVVALWFVPWALRVGGDEVAMIWTHQIRGRAVESHAHARPFWFYLEHFPVQFLPWTLLLPTMVLTWRRGASARDPGRRTLLAWFAAGFLVFSLVSGKRPVYLLPLYPAACLLLADHLRRANLLGRAGRVAAGITALLPAAVGVGVVVVVGFGSTPAFLTGACAIVVSAIAVALVIRGAVSRSVLVATLGCLVTGILAAVALGPVSDEHRSARNLSAAAARHMRVDETFVRYRTKNHSLPWYTEARWRWAGDEERLAELSREGAVLVTGEAEDVRAVPGIEILETVTYDGETWVIGRLPRGADGLTAPPESGR